MGQLFRQLGKTDGERLHLTGLLRDNPGEGAFAGNELILGPKARSVRYQADGPGSREPGGIDRLTDVELPFRGFCRHTGHKQLGQCFPVLVRIGDGRAAFPGLDIIFQLYGIVRTHTA